LWRLIGQSGGPIDPSDHNFIHSIKPTFPRSISFIQVVHAGKDLIGTEDVVRGQVRPHLAGPATPARPSHLQGWPCLVVRPCLPRVARWFHFPPKCVHIHKNCNTSRGTLLVSKMCMKLFVYSSQTRGFDGRIFVVRTINRVTKGKKKSQNPHSSTKQISL
jgi:hypothetical protein